MFFHLLCSSSRFIFIDNITNFTAKKTRKNKDKVLGFKDKDDPLLDFFATHKKQPSMSVLHLDLTMSQSEDAIAKHKMRKYFDLLKGKTAFDDWELACILHIYFKVSTF